MNQRLAWTAGGILIAALIGVAIYFARFQKGPEPLPDGPVAEEKEKVKDQPAVRSQPAIFEPAPVSLAAATEHYYLGKEAKQIGVQQNAIVAERAAVLKGRVLNRDGQPLEGVKVHVVHHPEFGHTLSQADGHFDVVVNGGGRLCVHYEKDGFLPLCRFISAARQDYTWLPDVALISVDKQVTAIDLKANAPIQAARSSPVKDKDGERQATLLIPQGTKAEMIRPDGTKQELTSLNVRLTEYSVGARRCRHARASAAQ